MPGTLVSSGEGLWVVEAFPSGLGPAAGRSFRGSAPFENLPERLRASRGGGGGGGAGRGSRGVTSGRREGAGPGLLPRRAAWKSLESAAPFLPPPAAVRAALAANRRARCRGRPLVRARGAGCACARRGLFFTCPLPARGTLLAAAA